MADANVDFFRRPTAKLILRYGDVFEIKRSPSVSDTTSALVRVELELALTEPATGALLAALYDCADSVPPEPNAIGRRHRIVMAHGSALLRADDDGISVPGKVRGVSGART